jgi:hypothetical protein
MLENGRREVEMYVLVKNFSKALVLNYVGLSQFYYAWFV